MPWTNFVGGSFGLIIFGYLEKCVVCRGQQLGGTWLQAFTKFKVFWRQCIYIAHDNLLQVARENSIKGNDFRYPFETSGILLI